MVVNDLTAVVPQLLAQGLMALRQFAIMPQLVNKAYQALAGRQGSTIDVPISSAIAVRDVAPAATPPSTEGVVPTSVPVPLTRWKEAPFYLDDSEQMQVMDGFIPMQAEEAVKALANEVDLYLLSLFSKFYGVAGTAGTTPFSDGTTKDATAMRTALNKQLAPLFPRHVVFDPEAEGSALNVRAFQDASWSGDVQALLNGNLNVKLGFRWWMDQNVGSHTAGTGTNYLVNNGAGYAAGTKTITVDTGTGTLLVGDIISFASHSQTYVVTSALAANSVSFEPGLLVAVANDVAIIGPGDTGGVGTHVLNGAFHRDAIAFATRPLEKSSHPASVIGTMADPISGLTLRLEISRQHKRDEWSFDILYGAAVIRRELGVRLLG